ncbi:hypothetical protein SAY87_028599 [Trapa incisa]|uniref:Uncharacterized protein n=1 Tax=Trapa incisa TaxID=236973 RepID=A0AAN7KV65_9MYRT|nr:hypothetical protein SAY87_028599 [Trapa incisa]
MASSCLLHKSTRNWHPFRVIFCWKAWHVVRPTLLSPLDGSGVFVSPNICLAILVHREADGLSGDDSDEESKRCSSHGHHENNNREMVVTGILHMKVEQVSSLYAFFCEQLQLLVAVKFVAHLINQQVAHAIIALELLTVLLEKPTDDSAEEDGSDAWSDDESDDDEEEEEDMKIRMRQKPIL